MKMKTRDLLAFGVALLATIVVLSYVRPATAQGRDYSYEQVTVSTSAIGVSSATMTGMAACQFRLEGAAIRFRQDGTDPTASVGMPLTTGDAMTMDNITDVRRAKFIRSGGSDGTLNVSCWSNK